MLAVGLACLVILCWRALVRFNELNACDSACEFERKAAREAVVEQEAEEKKRQMVREREPNSNETTGCKGQVFEVTLNQAPTDINPGKCAMRFEVLQGRMLLSDNSGGNSYDIGPEGPKETLFGDWLRFAQTRSGTARVKVLHCPRSVAAMLEWKCD